MVKMKYNNEWPWSGDCFVNVESFVSAVITMSVVSIVSDVSVFSVVTSVNVVNVIIVFSVVIIDGWCLGSKTL